MEQKLINERRVNSDLLPDIIVLRLPKIGEYRLKKERTLHLILSYILNQWRYFRIGLMW